MLPLIAASDIMNKRQRLYMNAADEPRDTSVSILGAPCRIPFMPLVKNFMFATIMPAANTIWSKAFANGLYSRNGGSGKPHMGCPIERYMSAKSKIKDNDTLALRFCRSLLVSVWG